MKIALIGGHLSPSLAVIDKISSDHTLIFYGRKHTFEGDTAVSLEYKVITEKNIPFISLRTGRLQRSLTRHTLPSLGKLPLGYFQSLKSLKNEGVDCVVSFGGYLSIPVCTAARTLHIPIVIHEQTTEAGFANKMVGKFASKVCISWESSRAFFPKEKIVLTGNPLRVYKDEKAYRILQTEKETPLLYITGGSSGSHVLNTLIEQSLPELLKKYRVLHQTGDAQEFKDYDRLVRLRDTLPTDLQKRYELHKFITPESVKSVLTSSSLVISRSGINTVTELLFFGVPSLLIPLPTGQKNEQYTNAQFLKKVGSAEVLEQKDATAEALLDHVERIVHNRSYMENAVKGRSLVRPDAAEKIVQVIIDAAQKKTT